jgi:crotonobetainyl-CoA:carnitine CoA-transferase CaiB-like acyl-CoA transferase
MSHWYEAFNAVHVPFGAVRDPQEGVRDPQLRANDIIVPLEGAGEKLTETISSPKIRYRTANRKHSSNVPKVILFSTIFVLPPLVNPAR